MVSHPNPLQLQGLLDGLGGSLLGQIPYGVLTFGSYEVYKRTIQEQFSDWNPTLQYALAAILGDMTGSLWLWYVNKVPMIMNDKFGTGYSPSNVIPSKALLKSAKIWFKLECIKLRSKHTVI